jgi:hypothetical protein
VSDRITPRQVEQVLGHVIALADELGIEHGRLVIERGSPTYGRAWRLFEHRDESGGLYAPFGGHLSDYLGASAREAYVTLHHYRMALAAAVYGRKGEQ